MRNARAATAALLPLLHDILSSICSDERVRACLQHEPERALRAFGFDRAGESGPLPIADTRLSVQLDVDTMLAAGRAGMTDILPSSLETCELRLVLAGAKPLALLHGSEDDMTTVLQYAHARGFCALLGPSGFVPESDAAIGGYSNRMREVQSPRARSGQWRGLLVSADTACVVLAWLALLFGWNRLLGSLLGYPACCSEYFERIWPRAHREFAGDPATMLLAHGEFGSVVPIDWRANVFARYFGYEVAQHFPCSLDCPQTLALADRNHVTLSHFWPEFGTENAARLADPLLVFPGAGVCLFPGASLESDGALARLTCAPGFARALGCAPDLSERLARGGAIVSHTPRRWSIGDAEYAGWLVHPGAAADAGRTTPPTTY